MSLIPPAIVLGGRVESGERSTLTEVDRNGGPNELLDRPAAARLLG